MLGAGPAFAASSAVASTFFCRVTLAEAGFFANFDRSTGIFSFGAGGGGATCLSVVGVAKIGKPDRLTAGPADFAGVENAEGVVETAVDFELTSLAVSLEAGVSLKAGAASTQALSPNGVAPVAPGLPLGADVTEAVGTSCEET